MPKLQDGRTVSERGTAGAGQVRLAVPDVPTQDNVGGGANPHGPTRGVGGGEWPASVPASTLPSAEQCWEDGAHLLSAHLIYRTANIGIFRWGVKQSPEGKGMVGIYAANWHDDSIWGWARCTCPIGQPWVNPCAHKAAAFLLARNLCLLPPGFPALPR